MAGLKHAVNDLRAKVALHSCLSPENKDEPSVSVDDMKNDQSMESELESLIEAQEIRLCNISFGTENGLGIPLDAIPSGAHETSDPSPQFGLTLKPNKTGRKLSRSLDIVQEEPSLTNSPSHINEVQSDHEGTP